MVALGGIIINTDKDLLTTKNKMEKTFKLSAEQTAIINHIASSNNNLCVNARAGSGKTSTIIHATKEYLEKHPNSKVLVLAFNKGIQTEIQTKVLDSRIEYWTMVKTTHAHGYSAIRFWYDREGDKDVKLTNSKSYWASEISSNIEKYSSIIKDDSTEKDAYRNKRTFVDNVVKILQLCRVNKAYTSAEINRVCDHYGIDNIIADEVSVVEKILERHDGIFYTPNMMVFDRKKQCYVSCGASYVHDFTSMIEFGAENPQWVSKYDLVIVDEAQDLNLVQHQLVFNSVKRNGKWVAVGDDRQAINGFCGALAESFESLQCNPNTDTLTLSTNYRCGKAIIAKAQEIVSDIFAHDGACEGSVDYVNSLSHIKQGDFILCRTKAPLMMVAMKFFKAHRNVCVVGNDICEQLVALIKKVSGNSKDRLKKTNTLLLFDLLQKEYEKTLKDIRNRGFKGEAEDSPTAITLKDSIESIEYVGKNFDSAWDTIEAIEKLFENTNDKKTIQLMTCHKSKGLESDNVTIILPNKLPLRWENQKDWQLTQEENLQYVAYTRARKSLSICTLSEHQLSEMSVEAEY